MENRPRKKWIAVIFTILTTGVGHIYCGQVKKGLILILLPIAAEGAAFLLLKACPSFLLLIFFVGLGFVYLIYCIVDVIRVAQSCSTRYELQKFNRWFVYLAIYIAVIAVPQLLDSEYIKQNITQAFRIPSGSMTPTLQIGDRLLAKTDRKSRASINHGDLVIFKYPEDRSKVFIKRVIATQGETISIQDKKVFINGAILTEPYVVHTDTRIFEQTQNPRDNLPPVKVPDNSYFVMGDNRDNAYDSRFWGCIKQSDIIGKPSILYWSWDKNALKVRFNRIGRILK